MNTSQRPWIDPASDSQLVIITEQPLNAEMSPGAWHIPITPTEQFYVRSHFPEPSIDAGSWRLQLDGAVREPHTWTLAELQALPSRTLTSTMACAGNNRLNFAPLPSGEPWGSGAVSTAVWQGVPLRDILAPDIIDGAAVEVLFTGADSGIPPGERDQIAFARSLPLEQALHPDTLLVYAMNGEPLSQIHGKPLRLLVPGWYGMASVKWLARISVLHEPFKGYYQYRRYVIEQPGRPEPLPLRTMNVASHIVSPQFGATLGPGTHTVRGLAWSGCGTISSVEVRDGQDKPWQRARLLGEPQPYTWREWEWTWQVSTPGRKIVQARASDSSGNTQPDVAAWNRFGYENNAIETLVVTIHGF